MCWRLARHPRPARAGETTTDRGYLIPLQAMVVCVPCRPPWSLPGTWQRHRHKTLRFLTRLGQIWPSVSYSLGRRLEFGWPRAWPAADAWTVMALLLRKPTIVPYLYRLLCGLILNIVVRVLFATINSYIYGWLVTSQSRVDLTPQIPLSLFIKK
jgi:hypothetical protein